MTVNFTGRIREEKPNGEIGESEIIYATEEHAKKFKRCLKFVRVETRIEYEGKIVTFYIRPKNPNSLKDVLMNRGMADTVGIQVCDFLSRNPDKWIRFVSRSKI
jgi:hypothetical protein